MATTDKYDRQLRLWGASGQRALSESTVVLIRATACGTETLKNLVLPGIGHMIIVDDCHLHNNNDNNNHEHQYASNFFLTSVSSSSSRAEQALEYLMELNPDVQGSFRQVHSVLEFDFVQLWQSTPNYNSSNNNWIFILADPEPPVLMKISEFCETHQIPLIVVISYGLIGIVKLQVTPVFPLIDPKPRDSIPDLRLVHPFPKLIEYAEAVMQEHFSNNPSHIPYPILLLHIQKQWKEKHGGNLPQNFAEKQSFQEMIKQLMVPSQSNDQPLNVQEAIQYAYTAYTPRIVPVQKYREMVQKYNHETNDTATNSNTSMDTTTTTPTKMTSARVSIAQFVVLLRALFEYIKQDKQQQPPLSSPSIPDMHASTELYVGLQTLYRTQALDDWKEFTRHVRSLEAQSQQQNSISDEIIQTFCQNIFSLDVLDTGTMHQEYKPLTVDGNAVASSSVTSDEETAETSTALSEALQEDSEEERPEQSPLLWYLSHRACQMFYEHHGRFPGTTGDNYTEDVEPVYQYFLQILQHYHLSEHTIFSNISIKDMAIEMVRYGNAEIHTIASVVGGVASQEAVKLITGQYVPLNNTYVYNGIASIGGVYKI